MKTITTVPASVNRTELLTAIAELGFDVAKVRKLEIGIEGIYVTVKEIDDEGRDMIGYPDEELIVNRIYVPIKD